ncbi:hypothetical protein D1007_22863 [Hordeum vulgare]|nr:hypothetical protein D1007_22863 [Hordeum vulgare]
MAALSDLAGPAEWPRAAMAALAAAVFVALDVVDVLLCLVYGVLDGFLEESPLGCYCHRSQGKVAAAGEEEDDGSSRRREGRCQDACREELLWLVAAVGGGTRRKEGASPAKARSPRWSDGGCGKCRAWRTSGAGGDRLRFVLQEPPQADRRGSPRLRRQPQAGQLRVHAARSRGDGGDAPPKAPVKKVVRKNYDNPADLRAPDYARQGMTLSLDNPPKKTDRMAAEAEAARNRPPQASQLRTQDEKMAFLFISVQGMEKNIQEILQNQKSLERVVETKFYDMDVKVTELNTIVKQLQH